MPRNHPPRGARGKSAGNLLEAELLQEKAANLGRLARGLQRALEALAEHDAAGKGDEGPSREPDEPGGDGPRSGDDGRRRRLLADAGEALFLYVAQREVLGLTGTAQVLDDLGVPREVRLRMAPRSVLLGR